MIVEVEIYNLKGEKVGTMKVDAEAFGEQPSRSLMHRSVVSYEANLRQGNACTKTRGERAGSGRKLWKQKGTGRARMGSIRSPLWRGGGVTFGPKPRDYRMKLSKNERKLALKGALGGKLRDGEIVVLDSMELPEIKTKVVYSFVKSLPHSGRTLFVSQGVNSDWLRASRNIASIETSPVQELNVLSVLKSKVLVFEKAAFEGLLAGGGPA